MRLLIQEECKLVNGSTHELPTFVGGMLGFIGTFRYSVPLMAGMSVRNDELYDIINTGMLVHAMGFTFGCVSGYILGMTLEKIIEIYDSINKMIRDFHVSLKEYAVVNNNI